MTELLCSYIAILDERNVTLTTAADRHEFILEMYVSNVLKLPVRDGFDLYASNDVEDLTYNTEYFRLMQQYTILPIYDLYKLNVIEWLNQPWPEIQFQLKMARHYQSIMSKASNDLAKENESIMIDESHRYEMKRPEFKRNFGGGS